MGKKRYEVLELPNQKLADLLGQYESEKDPHSLYIFPIGITQEGKNRILIRYREKTNLKA